MNMQISGHNVLFWMERSALCYSAQIMGKIGTDSNDRWATGYLVTPPKAVPIFQMSQMLSCNIAQGRK